MTVVDEGAGVAGRGVGVRGVGVRDAGVRDAGAAGAGERSTRAPRRHRGPRRWLAWARVAPGDVARLGEWRPGVRGRLRAAGDAGMATAEYAIATVAAVGFAGLLIAVLRSDEVRGLLAGIVRGALSV